MRAETHVLVFRLLLLSIFAFSALNCSDEDGPEGCDCDCLDSPGEPPDDDDDSSGVVGDDDDASPGDDDDDDEDVTLGLPPCEGGIAPAFSILEFEPPDANSDGYFAPSSDTLEAVLSSVQALMAGNLSLSMAEVAVVGYEVCRGEGPESGVALWRPVDPGTGRALFAWRAVGARPLILGVPYPVTESSTMTEGVLAFTELSARALIVGATNRCASTDSSDCDGTTAACGGGQQPYRDSDMQHVLDSVYQIAHEFLSEVHEDDLVVTLRGFSAFGVSISDGTTDPSSAETPAARFGQALADVMTDQYVSSCNDWPGASLDQRACGEDSVQGRYVNESPDPCTQVAPTASGRFIHVAQSDEVLGHMDEVVEVLGSILPEE